MKRALIIRLGAYGDMVLITPVLEELKKQGYYIILNTSERGMKLLKGDPRIDEFIEHKDDSMPVKDIKDHWDKLEKEVKHDLFINFSESIECNVALHPSAPQYIYPKREREEFANKNYYDETMLWAKMDIKGAKPILNFTAKEEQECIGYTKKDKFNIIWCLSGSGKQKVYPWTDYVMGETIKNYPDVHFITVGDKKCQILENLNEQLPKENVTELAGRVSIRTAMCLTKFVDLVISPDTGILHASGCYPTPKIGLLGHTTIENITKYFENDYSIEAQCECAPCFRLIYDWEIQCPRDLLTNAAWCMYSIRPEEVYGRIRKVIKAKG
jgi:ADP-heptose:LPS heptosyltransferase